MTQRRLRITVLVLAFFIFFNKNSVYAQDAHSGQQVCSVCHTMHFQLHPKTLRAEKLEGPFGNLLTKQKNDLCLMCHDGTRPSSPDVTSESFAGGKFTLSGDPNIQHSLGSTESPPGFIGDWREVLTCALCHNPHGNRYYRNLQENVALDTNITVTYETTPKNMYTGQPVIQELYFHGMDEKGGDFLKRYDEKNISYRLSENGSEYGLSIWCATCHKMIHGIGGDAHMGGSPSGDYDGMHSWIQHPTIGITLSRGVRNGHINDFYWWSKKIKSRPPYVSASGDIGTPFSSDNTPFCGTCHKAHGSDNIYSLIFSNPNTPELCDGNSITGTCQACHFIGDGKYGESPHGDPATGVFWNKRWARGDCTQCHRLHGGDKSNLLSLDDNELCYTCHGETPTGATAGYPARESDRVPYNPSIDAVNYFGYFEYYESDKKTADINDRVRWPGKSVFEDSNTYEAEAFFSPHRHDPDMPDDGACTNCHSPHGSEKRLDMLIYTYQPQDYTLCFNCHSEKGPEGMDEESKRIKYFYDTNINERAGHNIRKSSGSASEWPEYIYERDTLSCSECHNPHGSMGNNFGSGSLGANARLISDQRPGWENLTDTLNDPDQTRRFCFGCHVPADKSETIMVNGIKMSPIRSTMDQDAHKSTSNTGCYDCHGKDYSSRRGYNVHRPSVGGECDSCHKSQGISGGDFSAVHSYHTGIDNSSGGVERYGFACECCHSQLSISHGNISHAAGAASGENPGGSPPNPYQYAEIRFHDLVVNGWRYRILNGKGLKYRSIYYNPYLKREDKTPVYNTASPYITDGIEYTKGEKVIGWTDQSSPELKATCLNIWCHSNANPVVADNVKNDAGNRLNLYRANLKWYKEEKPVSSHCANCHGHPIDPANEFFLSGKDMKKYYLSTHHERHTGNGDHLLIPCGECHSQTAPLTWQGRIKGDTGYKYHVNGNKDVSFNKALNPEGMFDPLTRKCSNLYCHSAGKSARDEAYPGDKSLNSYTISWTSASIQGCGVCHAVDDLNSGSHTVHLAAVNGPHASCNDCHKSPDPPYTDLTPLTTDHINGKVDFLDGKGLSDTLSCNPCHSQTKGEDAKQYWYSVPSSWLSERGKDYCLGCHGADEVKSRSDGQGVIARNIFGDGLNYGIDVSGHKQVECIGCHDPNAPHIDHIQQPLLSYIKEQENPTNFRFYQDGKRSILLPFDGLNTPDDYARSDFALCFYCHDNEVSIMLSAPTPEDAVSLVTNFADKECNALNICAFVENNLHRFHICNLQGEQNTTCVLCHDPHSVPIDNDSIIKSGPKMTRDFLGLMYFDANGCPLDSPEKWEDESNNKGGAITEDYISNGLCNSLVCHPALQRRCDYRFTGNGPEDGWYRRSYATCVSCHVKEDLDNIHKVHLSEVGVRECILCHSKTAYHEKEFSDNAGFEDTTVCDQCHSPQGIFNGVYSKDLSTGAKDNWHSGIYNKEREIKGYSQTWCAGCHDNGISEVKGVRAPDIIGDNTTYGFYVSGHNFACNSCHDSTMPHCDSIRHTYNAKRNNYQEAFRLRSINNQYPVIVPRNNQKTMGDPQKGDNRYFELCFSCHNEVQLLGGPIFTDDYYLPRFLTNFRQDDMVILADANNTFDICDWPAGKGCERRNSHYTHLKLTDNSLTLPWDSDRDGQGDSMISCPACHNTHGTRYPAMIRDGRMIGHEPGLNFSYVRFKMTEVRGEDACDKAYILTTEGADLKNSIGGIMRIGSGFGAGGNGICECCHECNVTGYAKEYAVNCGAENCVDYYRNSVIISSCIGCHNGPSGQRRAIVGTDGDFSLRSTHVSHIGPEKGVRDEDCSICHDTQYHSTGVIRLKDPDSNKIFTFDPGDNAKVEGFCLNCHDTDGSVNHVREGNPKQPFSDLRAVSDIKTGWGGSAHKRGGLTNSGYTCLGDGVTTGCHNNAHGSRKSRLLAPYNEGPGDKNVLEEEGFCFSCHSELKAGGEDIIDTRTTNYHSVEEVFAKDHRHNVRDGEEGHIFTMGTDTYELECTSCHDPHLLSGSFTEVDKSPIIRFNSKDLWGDDQTEKITAFINDGIYQPVRSVDTEISHEPDLITFCLDCHGNSSVSNINWSDNAHGLKAANAPFSIRQISAFEGLDKGLCNEIPFWRSYGETKVGFPKIPKGRGYQSWILFPYSQQRRIEGENYILNCTDCHDAHASSLNALLREEINGESVNSVEWPGLCAKCHSFDSAIHYAKEDPSKPLSCSLEGCHAQAVFHSGMNGLNGLDSSNVLNSSYSERGDFNTKRVLLHHFDNLTFNGCPEKEHGASLDSSDYQLHCYLYNGLGFNTDGVSNECLFFDGVDDYAEFGGSLSLSEYSNVKGYGGYIYFEMKEAMSIMCFIYPQFNPGDVSRKVILSNEKQANYTLALDYRKDEGWPEVQLRLVFYVYASDGTDSGLFWGTSSVPVAPSSWMHVAATYEKDAKDGKYLKVYINGQELTSHSLSHQPLSNNYYILPASEKGVRERLVIGAHPGMKEWFSGRIDELKLYNLALSADEIRQEYEGYTPPDSP